MSVRLAALLVCGACASQPVRPDPNSPWGRFSAARSDAAVQDAAARELSGMQLALVHRAQWDRTRGGSPLGSFTRRASAADIDRLRAAVDPRLVPAAFTGAAVEAWEAALDRHWADPATAIARDAGNALIREIAPVRDEVDVLFVVNKDPLAYFTDLQGGPAAGRAAFDAMTALRSVAFELALEADVLTLASSLDDAAPFEEFLQRYPEHAFAASALFVLAVICDVQGNPGQANAVRAKIRERFPTHPIAASLP